MNVLIFSGGSGSDSLQKGLYELYPELDITILTNAYDNGKSTGLIRQVFDGKILGPSDVRKNQTRRLKLQYGNIDLYLFLEHRFTSDKPREYIRSYYNDLCKSEKLDVLYQLVEEYFDKVPKANEIPYEDFSIGNIVYGYLSYKFGYSLQAVADWMSDHLELSSTVILNSDESLFLQAITESGKIIFDEADIVDYSNDIDKIVDIRFLTSSGKIKSHSVMCTRAIDAIKSADMIIFSTGTQWSSLIPTYKCKLEKQETSFSDLLEESLSKKFFLINAKPDKDMIGLTGDDIIKTVSNFFNVELCEIVSGNTKIKPKKFKSHISHLGFEKYEPLNLASEIMWLYFNKPTKNDTFIFDYDNTLVGRRGSYPNVSKFNLENLPEKSFIITGNTHSKINIKDKLVFADGGANLYKNSQFIMCLDETVKISNETYNDVKDFLEEHGFNISMLHNRNEICLNIKPIVDQYRKLFSRCLKTRLKHYDVNITGLTSIDVVHPNNNKLLALKYIFNEGFSNKLFYIGDELIEGNDKILEDNKKDYGLTTINVKSPVDTRSFIKSIKEF